MEDNETTPIQQETVGEATAPDYIQVIEDLKQNSVNKQDYEKLQAENKRLLEAFAKGQQLPPEYATKAQEKDLDAMRKDLFNKEGQTNLEYVTKALELRDAIIEGGGNDPFLPVGSKIQVSPDDVTKAEKVAAVLRECVEIADGDPNVFTRELDRRIIDTGRFMPKRRN